MATLCARVTFHAHGRTIEAGDELQSTDPVVKGRELLFDVTEAAAAEKPKRTTKKVAAK